MPPKERKIDRAANIRELRSWVGSSPLLAPLGFSRLVADAAFLLSARTLPEVLIMLQALNEAAKRRPDITNNKWELPDPGYNWPLHGEPLWRLVEAEEKSLKEHTDARPWELVAAFSLNGLRRSVVNSMAGLNGPREAVSTQAQRLIAHAATFISLAQAERYRDDVRRGKASALGIQKANSSSARKETKIARYKDIRRDYRSLKEKNPRQSQSAIADKLVAFYERERPDVKVSKSTIIRAVKEPNNEPL
ncbi:MULTISPECIES: hypothetical protein [unclassified Herbaspirillum]|uniref:hypothetical protein n=1 Tax=unclassified Herbaspirillum TaxID=2624150 RepID=UPI00114E6664|nr:MULTISPECIES: hypothetical protein [unclassified Herbaspirillum]MBB5393052.1 hypothetical protein [Herbaspirillum sp. SJZ102]TQK04305.1 hypothetical protein FB599_2857 [Herbaspirillum sp. SJZ130]TQK09910.1 hypothetical protein FB598_2905 [Herbaspirillum sp. SJZ106]